MIELCCEYLSVGSIWLYVSIMSRTSFRANPYSIVTLNVKELLARTRHHIWGLTDSNEIRTHNQLVRKRTLNHLAKLAKWLSCIVGTYLYGAFECMLLSCHVRVSEWIHTLYLNVKEILAKSRSHIWDLNDCNKIGTRNHLVPKWTFNHSAKLAKWLSCVVSAYLYGAFDCMLLSCNVRVSESIHNL